MKPIQPDDTPDNRLQLHAAIRSGADEATIFELIARGADPSKCEDGHNAYSIARQCGYSEAFCQKMDEAFSRWLQPLDDTKVVFITQNANTLWTTLEQRGWTRWCKGTGHWGVISWSSSFRLYYAQWEMEAYEDVINGRSRIALGLPKEGFDEISQLLDEYGVIWSQDVPED